MVERDRVIFENTSVGLSLPVARRAKQEGVKPNEPMVVATQKPVPDFGEQTPDLLRRDLLEFVCEPVVRHVWFSEFAAHASLEQRIFDGAGNQVGRVSEQPPYRRPRLRGVISRDETFRGAVYDRNDDKVVQFFVYDQIHWISVLDYVQSGRRLEVRDASHQLIGTLLAEEKAFRGTFLDRADERIGAIRKARTWGVIPDADCLVDDGKGTEIGWIATPRIHAKRQATMGIAVDPSSLKRKWFGSESQERHFLSITSRVSQDLRLMLLAVSAAIHLGVVDTPSEPDGD